MNFNNKLEVLRSDKTIRENIKTLIEEGVLVPSSEIDINTSTISEILKATVSNVEIENLIKEKASNENSTIGVHNDILPKLNNNYSKAPLLNTMVYNTSYSDCIKNNKPLQNDYPDYIRGNVISLYKQPNTQIEEFDYYDHEVIKTTGIIPMTNSHDQYKKFFLISDAFNQNKISNCFKNQDLSNGASISFWVKFDLGDTYNNKGLLLFVGDHEKHYFDLESKEKDIEYAEITPHLYISNLFDIVYEEAFFNFYKKENKNPQTFWDLNIDNGVSHKMHRSNKAWVHISISFTNENIDVYVNGIKVKYDDKLPLIGKRFNKSHQEESQYKLRTSILDFLSDNKTNLYLGVSYNKESNSGFFDDITFYNKSIDTEEEALEVYNEALKINLP